MEPMLVFITFFLVVGATLVSYFYLRSKERQMLIEKGLPSEQIHALYYRKPIKTGFILLQIGIILVFFGIGLGAGTPFVDRGDSYETLMAVSIFIFTGIGFIVANLVGKSLEKKERNEEEQKQLTA